MTRRHILLIVALLVALTLLPSTAQVVKSTDRGVVLKATVTKNADGYIESWQKKLDALDEQVAGEPATVRKDITPAAKDVHAAVDQLIGTYLEYRDLRDQYGATSDPDERRKIRRQMSERFKQMQEDQKQYDVKKHAFNEKLWEARRRHEINQKRQQGTPPNRGTPPNGGEQNDPPRGQPPAGSPPTGNPPTGTPPAYPPSGSPPIAQPPGRTPPAGYPPAGQPRPTNPDSGGNNNAGGNPNGNQTGDGRPDNIFGDIDRALDPYAMQLQYIDAFMQQWANRSKQDFADDMQNLPVTFLSKRFATVGAIVSLMGKKGALENMAQDLERLRRSPNLSLREQAALSADLVYDAGNLRSTFSTSHSPDTTHARGPDGVAHGNDGPIARVPDAPTTSPHTNPPHSTPPKTGPPLATPPFAGDTTPSRRTTVGPPHGGDRAPPASGGNTTPPGGNATPPPPAGSGSNNGGGSKPPSGGGPVGPAGRDRNTHLSTGVNVGANHPYPQHDTVQPGQIDKTRRPYLAGVTQPQIDSYFDASHAARHAAKKDPSHADSVWKPGFINGTIAGTQRTYGQHIQEFTDGTGAAPGQSIKNLDLRGKSAEQIHQEMMRRGFTHLRKPLKSKAIDPTTNQPVYVPQDLYYHRDGGMVRVKPEGVPDDAVRQKPHASKSVLANPAPDPAYQARGIYVPADDGYQNEAFKVTPNDRALPAGPNAGLKYPGAMPNTQPELEAYKDGWTDFLMSLVHVNLP